MNKWMKRGIVATTLAIVAVLAMSFSAFAFAKGTTQQSPAPAYGQGYGLRVDTGYTNNTAWAGPQNSLVAVAANVLGMKQADLVAELSDKTIAQVAQEKGVAIDKIVNAFLAPRITALQTAVADGRLTQAQADQMLATMKAHVTEQLSEAWTPAGPGTGSGVPAGAFPGGRWGR
jgi:hypothetical protein